MADLMEQIDMTKHTCSTPDCERDASRRGWCMMHYQRWRAHGDPTVTLRPRRAWGQGLKRDGDCLLWEYSLDSSGYGRVTVNGAQTLAHRHAYMEAHGPIPDGMLVDHVCHNRTCVNPEHLRMATRQQNNANRGGATALSSTGARGVYPDGARFKVGVRSHGVLRFYGTFDTIEEASRVAERERARLFGNFAGRG